MTYAQLNINQKINFKSWFSDTTRAFSVKDLCSTEIPDTCTLVIEYERHPTEWRAKL